jgi:hypothetical protein
VPPKQKATSEGNPVWIEEFITTVRIAHSRIARQSMRQPVAAGIHLELLSEPVDPASLAIQPAFFYRVWGGIGICAGTAHAI